MSRKLVLPLQHVMIADDMSVNQTSAITKVQNLDNLWCEIEWSGGSGATAGSLYAYVASTVPGVTGKTTIFKPLVLAVGGSIVDFVTISGASGVATINFNQVPFELIEFRYIRSGGGGSLDVYLTGKDVGS